MPQNTSSIKPPFVTIAIACALVAIYGFNQLFNKIDAASKPPAEDYKSQFYETVDCAALMAVVESITKGKISPNSNVFSLIGYTLGQAQDYALKAGIDVKEVKPLYDNKIITYYLNLSNATEQELSNSQQQANHCIALARHYDPKTMIDAALEEAKNNKKIKTGKE